MRYTLYGRKGWGSVIIETQLQWYDMAFDLQIVDDLFESERARSELQTLNPLAQLPTLVLPDGRVLTESAAITLHLADAAAARGQQPSLVPMQSGPQRDHFLRWLIYVVANIYPTFTYGDEPSRFVAAQAAQSAFRERLDGYAQTLYGHLEAASAAPWFLGATLSALDFYIATLVRWRPGPAWFAAQAPALYRIALQMQTQLPQVTGWASNFPEPLPAMVSDSGR